MPYRQNEILNPPYALDLNGDAIVQFKDEVPATGAIGIERESIIQGIEAEVAPASVWTIDEFNNYIHPRPKMP